VPITFNMSYALLLTRAALCFWLAAVTVNSRTERAAVALGRDRWTGFTYKAFDCYMQAADAGNVSHCPF
jgi:hypothetical protein